MVTCAKVLVADDHAVFREGLRLLMEARGFAAEVLEAADAATVEALVADHADIDLAVLDLYMPGMEGLALVRRLQAARPDMPLVVLTASERRQDLRAVLEVGATGFIPKSYAIADILAALRRVLVGESFFPADWLGPEDPAAPTLEIIPLSPRQRQVLALIAEGLSNKNIADRLDTALPTVKNHVANILERLGTTNRVAAVHLGRKMGLIPDDTENAPWQK